jgi:transposase
MLNSPYPSDVSDKVWAVVAAYLTLMREEVPQRDYSLREVFNALCWLIRTCGHSLAGRPYKPNPII